ncbi:zinc finger CCHC-type and RNA-binding motif-containing protein 1-like [Ischnura elegans]|uniref:zinc finger CCHC-type and RNA-binding motif-containing protein 1-like n=1 Tax=Ischnura elegans TaxID=197161 RepID=UPI001ED87FA3|nr:zinc finger CCHC-type and RNA-binding motif-containing protein 1-like [Ischnura elegans]
MSQGLAPSKSTVYLSNIPYSLTNNDLHKIFEKYGRVVKVTVVKDKITRRSKGVAFILFFSKDDAQKCARAVNNREMFGRTLKCSIAHDNGRASEFIRRRSYPDKSRCYECGEVDSHLSYECPKNALGIRQPPPKKKKKKHNGDDSDGEVEDEEDESYTSKTSHLKPSVGVEQEESSHSEPEEPDLETLSAAIKLEQEQAELEAYRLKVATGNYDDAPSASSQKKKIRPSAYFSDEEDVSD